MNEIGFGKTEVNMAIGKRGRCFLFNLSSDVYGSSGCVNSLPDTVDDRDTAGDLNIYPQLNDLVKPGRR